MLTGNIALLATNLSRFGNRTLPLEETDHRSNGMRWENRSPHMNMRRHQMAFNNLTLLLTGQGMEYLTLIVLRLGLPRVSRTNLTWYLQSYSVRNKF